MCVCVVTCMEVRGQPEKIGFLPSPHRPQNRIQVVNLDNKYAHLLTHLTYPRNSVLISEFNKQIEMTAYSFFFFYLIYNAILDFPIICLGIGHTPHPFLSTSCLAFTLLICFFFLFSMWVKIYTCMFTVLVGFWGKKGR